MTTATTIDLSRFVAREDETREYLRTPFRRGAWVYATNRHICVRVPADGVEATDLDPKRIPDLETKFGEAFARAGAFAPLPELPPLLECETCSGRGWHAVRKCPSCTEGEFVHYTMTYDCLLCVNEPISEPGWMTFGEGNPDDRKLSCNECHGRGAQMAGEQVGGVLFELAYLHWLAALPGVTVRTHGPADAMAVKFDGGEALLMPRNY